MNNFPPEMAKMVMDKVIERVKQGDVKSIAISFGDEEEGFTGEREDSSAEMCGKCGCSCEDSDNYCRECGCDLNKQGDKVYEKEGQTYEKVAKSNPDKDKEGKGDVDTKEVAKQEYGDNGGSNEEEVRNIEKLKEYSKKQ